MSKIRTQFQAVYSFVVPTFIYKYFNFLLRMHICHLSAILLRPLGLAILLHTRQKRKKEPVISSVIKLPTNVECNLIANINILYIPST